LRVVRQVGSRLRRLVGIIEELSFTTVRDRLIAHLLRLARTEGRKTARGVEVDMAGSQQDLAASLGTVRELVSRNLTRLQAEGLVVHEGKVIVIPDPAKLEAEQRAAG
jgi:CRP/FNR family transcriptional regulator